MQSLRGRLLGLAVIVSAALACAPAAASAQLGVPNPPALQAPSFGHFRSVLAQGEGGTATLADLLNGTVPATFTDQTPLYSGIMPHATTLTAADLNVYYKDTDFGSMPGGIGSYESPEPGVKIYFDQKFGMAHIYANTFNELAWACGYEQAQERLFLMDVLRRTAEGTLAGLLGPSAASGDAQQLTTQDFSAQELTAQAKALPQKFGAAGAKALDALNEYVAGINARIGYDEINPAVMPAEYTGLGAHPPTWTIADSAAESVMLESQFTVSGGSQQLAAELQQEFHKRFGHNWQTPYDDLSEPEDPAALTIQSTPVSSDNAGKIEPKLDLNAVPNAGSIVARNDLLKGPSTKQGAADLGSVPSWVTGVEHLHASMPTVDSNAVLVSAKLSKDGRPLAAMGPQVGYYSPQIFSEYELHGGGVNTEGVVFPGADPFPLISHGIDFAWSGTSANGIDQDTFAELLCNPNGSPATDASTHYRYKGRCIPFTLRKQTVTTPVGLESPGPSQTIVYQAERSIHGPVFAYARVGSHPVALTDAKAVDFHELNAIVAFMELAENVPKNAHQFRQVMGQFPGTETWFYVDDKDIAYQESGFYPEHAKHSNPNLPYWGTGKADWIDFNPRAYTEKELPPSERPGETDPPDGYLISWNNKEAPGWYLGPTEWDGGPIQHALILKQRLFNEIRAGHGKTNLVGLARAVNTTATTDLREFDVWPVMRRVLGHVTGPDAHFVALLNRWHAVGSQRLAPAGSNIYGNSAAVSVMDAWWPLVVKAIFKPALGSSVFQSVLNNALGLPSPPGDEFGGYDWTGAVYTDLRDALLYNKRGAKHLRSKHRPAPGSHIVSWNGSYSRIYCGNPSVKGGAATLRACRAVLLSSLTAAIAQAKKQLGANPAAWKVDATCPQTSPPSCDQEVPTTGGAIATPPFPWQDRGTYHQIVELDGHRR